MIARRAILATAPLLAAPAIVRAASLMAVKSPAEEELEGYFIAADTTGKNDFVGLFAYTKSGDLCQLPLTRLEDGFRFIRKVHGPWLVNLVIEPINK